MPDKDKMPTDPMSNILTGAVSMHEMYKAYVKAGFSKSQAMQLVATALRAVIMKENGNCE